MTDSDRKAHGNLACLLACLLGGIALAASPARGQTPIDDFTDAGPNTGEPPGIEQTTVGSTTGTDTGLSGVIGGSRQLTVEATVAGGGSPSVKAGVITGAEIVDYSSSVLADGLIALLYDADGTGLSADLSLATGIEFDIVTDLAAIPYDVALTLTDGATQTVTQNIVTSGTQHIEFDFADFPAVDLSDLFSIELVIDPNLAGDLEVVGPVITFGEPFCGNGVTELVEECDDGNAFGGDGCEVDCTISNACTYVHGGVPTERFVGLCGLPAFLDIQSAVNASSDGDIVTVCDGAYVESITVSKEVTIRSQNGPGATTIQSPGIVFDVQRSGVRIEGFGLTGGTAAIVANSICPLSKTSCPSPGKGSTLTIVGNQIANTPKAITWDRKIDCVSITNNTMTDNDAHIEIVQADPEPAVFVTVQNNTMTGGGQSGASVRLENLGSALMIAQNTIEGSDEAGLILGNVADDAQVAENNIRNHDTDGILILPGAAGARIVQNNIEDNLIGLANEAPEAIVDATLNWWGSQTGPFHALDRPSAVGDEIQERVAGFDTEFIEFLCQPAPGGFPSTNGECSTEPSEVVQLAFGRSPDISARGRYISFVSDQDLNGNAVVTIDNADGSDEVFLLDRKPGRKPGAYCVGGINPNDPCERQRDCEGNPLADPIVNDGACVLVTQASNDASGAGVIQTSRVDRRGDIFFDGDADFVGANPDGSIEVLEWNHRTFRRQSPPDPNTVVTALSAGGVGEDTRRPAPANNGRRVVVESTGNPTGGNADGNSEIFLYDVRKNTWTQITNTTAPIQNLRPSTRTGRRLVFDSNADLHNDPSVPPRSNADGNREIFLARRKRSSFVFQQLTDTVAPVENRAASTDRNGKLVVFSSNANFTGQNADGNREIFSLLRGSTFEQISHSTVGENDNPDTSFNGSLRRRFIVFESTANLEDGGNVLTNRRIFQYKRGSGELVLVSRSFFGENTSPRISRGRFTVWESTANLNGTNPGGESVIYVYDRRSDK